MDNMDIKHNHDDTVRRHNDAELPRGDIYPKGNASRVNELVTRLTDNPLALMAVSASLGFMLGGLLMGFRRSKALFINIDRIEVNIRRDQQDPD